MSRQRSRSPRYRRFPWDEPDFDPYKVLAELDGNPQDRSHHPREDPEEHWDYFRPDEYPEGQRRSPPFPRDHQEEFYRGRRSLHHDMMDYGDQRFSSQRDIGEDVDGRRGGFREDFHNFESRGRSPLSPLRLARESLPLTSKFQSDHSQRESGMGWRREEQGRDRGRIRDLSPSVRSDDQRGVAGRERGRRNAQAPNRDRRREDPSQERNLPFKRQRREMDDVNHLGYGNEEEFGDQRYSVGTPRGGFGGDTHGGLPHGEIRHSGPLVIEHDHGIVDGREPPLWEQFDNRQDHDLDRHRSPRPASSSSQERFRMSNSRSDVREDMRGRQFQDIWRDESYHETKRSPLPQDRPSPIRYSNRDSSTNHRGRGGARPVRAVFSRGQGGRTRLPKNQHVQQSPQGYQDLAHEQQRPEYRALREDAYEDPIQEEPKWADEDRLQQWERERPASLDRHLPRVNLDPKMPRQRQRGWSEQKTNNMDVVTEETLTIKVDMSRPVHQNSQMCYSSDRQLSLDLVNVGRQRLDFLPMLEHSGTYRESATHTGTFAQEIITLVHHVKEQYFRGNGASLNERFSAPQKGGYTEEETEEELTLDQRFSSNRGFSLNVDSLLDDDEPLFSRLGPMKGLSQPPMRGPGDLRHDLERRRQERLEGVKVTIRGHSPSQPRTAAAGSEQSLEFADKDETVQMEDGGFSTWPEEHSRRREGSTGPRRGASFRLNTGPQRRNNRFGNRQGPMRRQNNRNNHAGPNW